MLSRRSWLLRIGLGGSVVGLVARNAFWQSEMPGGHGRISSSGETFVNPRVAPGLVRWHSGFDAARAAARASGKPVFLFQMMGRRDQQFC